MGAGVAALCVALIHHVPLHIPTASLFFQVNRIPLTGENVHTFEIHTAGGRTPVPFIGDIDPRLNFQLGFIYCKPEPRFRMFERRLADLMQELYFEYSYSPGTHGIPANDFEAIGYLFGGRKNWRWNNRLGTYMDLGWGFQYANHRTVDLPSRFNSTPFLDLGLWFPNRAHPYRIGLRYLHISNARQVGTNHGQNQLFLDVGVRF